MSQRARQLAVLVSEISDDDEEYIFTQEDLYSSGDEETPEVRHTHPDLAPKPPRRKPNPPRAAKTRAVAVIKEVNTINGK
jgi:hypothetical protein